MLIAVVYSCFVILKDCHRRQQMQPPPPPTPYETNVMQSYQILAGARMQSAIMHQSVPACINKCLDTEELYTLLRTNNAPIKYRLEKDLAEKKCIENCGAKWDELYRRTVMRLNQRETQVVQFKAMEAAMSGAAGAAE